MVQRGNKNRWAPVVLIVLLLLALLVIKTCNKSATEKPEVKTETRKEPKSPKEPKTTTAASKGLDRNPSAINYSKHARCRMACRHITESEVKDILQNGKINYAKSEIGGNPDCKKKYAVEGETNDQQRVRIIFAPCQSEVTVVTVIDLGKEWACDCE